MMTVDSNGIYTEEREIQGDAVTTPNLHNVGAGCAGYEKPANDDGKWCFNRSSLSVKVPGANWIFVGTPTVKCVAPDCGGAGWSRLGASDRFFVTRNNPDKIEADILTGSHSFKASLFCTARFYPPGLLLDESQLTNPSDLPDENLLKSEQ